MRPLVRRAGYVVFLVAVSLLAAELAAPYVLSRLRDLPPSRAALRDSLVASEEEDEQEEAADGEGLEGDEGPRWMSRNVLHPYLGFVVNPDLARPDFNGYPVDEGVNAFGFFGPALPAGDAADRDEVYAIALLGGSMAAELYLHGREALTAALAPALPPGRRPEVYCLAVGGMKQPQQLLAVEYLLTLGRAPDLLIALDGFNEVAFPWAENRRYGVHPAFPQSWNVYAASAVSPEAIAIAGDLTALRDRTRRRRARLAGSPLGHSYLVLALAGDALAADHQRLLALEGELRRRLVPEGGEDLGSRETGPPYDWSDPDRYFADAAAIWRRGSRRLAALAASEGIPYVHFLQPNQYVPGSKPLTPRERREAFAGPDHDFRQAVEAGYPELRRAGAALRQAGVAFHDLTDVFAGHADTLYVDRCCHVSPVGSRLLGREIGHRVAAQLAQ